MSDKYWVLVKCLKSYKRFKVSAGTLCPLPGLNRIENITVSVYLD